MEFDFILTGEDGGGTGTLTYVFSGGGSIEVDCDVHINPTYRAVPRVGVELDVCRIRSWEYYGFGPIENYSDRLLSAKLGVYGSTVEEQHFAFVPPSETAATSVPAG